MSVKKYLVLTGVLLAGVGAQAQTATITVIGSVTPSPCGIQMTGGGNVDFGTMTKNTVQKYPKKNTAFIVPTQSTAVNITCDSDTAVTLSWVDNKAGTKASIETADDNYLYGIGLHETNRIGAYSIDYTGLQFTSAASPTASTPSGFVTRLASATGAAGWNPMPAGFGATLFAPNNAYGVKTVSTQTAPAAVKTLSGVLKVTPYLLQTVIDAATTEVKLDGSATFTLNYI